MDFKIPELGEGVMEGELVKWRVAVGETVSHDQPLFEVMTDKATVEVPSPFEGKVTGLHAKEGEIVEVNQVVVSYGGDGDSAAAPAPEKKKEEKAPEPAKAAPVAAAPAPSQPAAPQASINIPPPVTASSSDLRAAPATRKLAREMGVDISGVQGSGPEGRIMKADLEKFSRSGGGAKNGRASSPSVQRNFPAGEEQRIPFRGLRRIISERMRESKDNAAHFTYVEEADATDLAEAEKSR